jgi:DNA invertase Pin-like site-specific DNA recombinase
MNYIYQRISTDKQSLIRQEGAIGDYCKANNLVVPQENVFSDVITGKTIKRENYKKMKDRLQKNDTLILLDLDRLGRNWDLIKQEWKELTDKGVYIVVVNCPIINALPDASGTISIDKRLIQEMMFTLLCYISQKEVEKISIRTKEALKAKKEQGVHLGRRETYGEDVREKIRKLINQGYSQTKVAFELGVSRTVISREIKKWQEN